MRSPAVVSSALLLSSLSLGQSRENPVNDLHQSVEGILQAVSQRGESTVQRELLIPRLERLEKTLGKFDLKLRAFSGSSGNIRHWIGSYTEGTTKLTALFEELSNGKGYSGFDLRLNKLRFNFGAGENRQRMNITLYGKRGSYLGYATQNDTTSEEAIYGGVSFGAGFSADTGAISNGDARLHLLHDNGGSQISGTVGRDKLGHSIATLSINDKKSWFIAQGGQSIPTSYRLTFGDIDQQRSQRASAFIDGGLNEAFPNAATYKISAGESPTFHMIRRIPGQFLGMRPGDTGIDILYTNNTSFDVSAGLRLKDSGDMKSPFIGARYQRDLKLGGNRFGFELGSNLGSKDAEVRARIEYSDKTKQTSFGILITTKLK